MILYHYSVDSYKDGKELINDYKKQYRFAEPYILALEKGRSVFDAVFFSTMYLSRELCGLELRKYENYCKDAVEGIFEYVRKTEYSADSVSRIGCVYYCDSMEAAKQYLYDDCISNGLFTTDQVCLLEVRVDDSRIFRYDQQYFNMALEAAGQNKVDDVFEYAREYFAKRRTDSPLIEILCDSPNEITRQIAL